jgi:hypothetical protein
VAVARALAIVALACRVAAAQPPQAPSDVLRQGNEAAAAGDWAKVSTLVEPMLRTRLARPDLAEAHRLAGIAAFYQQQAQLADHHFFEYLKLDLEAQLDQSLYPPDVVGFFNDVRLRHRAELRALQPKQKRYWILNLLPPGGQLQNGDRTKAIVVGSLIGAFAISNVTTFLVLRSWCTRVQGDGGSSVTCDEPKDHSTGASQLRALNILSGVGLLVTYAYGVYDGVSGYRRKSREQRQPYLVPVNGGGVVGFGGAF